MNDKNRQLAIDILDLFEELLEKYDITIPSEDRDEDSSRLHGEEYFELEDAITNLLNGEE